MRRGDSLQRVFVTLKHGYMREPDIVVMGRGRLASRLYWSLSHGLDPTEVKLRQWIESRLENGST